jgi:uncharacterized peroxidase-related enzyme
MAWLETISRGDATGELAEVYATMTARPIPQVYAPAHGDAPGIIRAHSLDPELMRRTFGTSSTLHGARLEWAERELLSSITSRTNECFYWTSSHAEFLRVASGDAALSEAVLNGKDDQLPERGAALAGYAATLTAQPWTVTPELVAKLATHGLDAEEIEAATGVVAVFNYLTRVADASGIEWDYASPLPRFEPERGRRAVIRPDRESWPVVGAEFRRFPRLPALSQAWERWHEYVFSSDEPLSRRERGVLALAAARACCDRWRADSLAGHEPGDDAEARLAGFATKLSREPWRMQPSDLRELRALGHSEPALLHAIAVVALQNAESRVAMGRGLAQAVKP